MSQHDRPRDPDAEPGAGDDEVAGHAELAEFAEHATYAEFAEHAERAEFAGHAAHAEQEADEAAVEAASAGGGPARAASHQRGRVAGRPHVHLGPYAQPDAWRAEVAHLLDQAVGRVQAVGRSRIHRQDKPEPRWPVTAAVAAAIVLQAVLPAKLILGGHLHQVLLAAEVALVLALIAANPVRIERRSRPIRAASIALITAITAGNAVSAVLLVRAILTGTGEVNRAGTLLLAGAAIWGTNVIAFALWYWEFDRGGPVHRLEGTSAYPDLLFAQMTVPELTPAGWGPRFVDYLYLSFTNATAFSPTDTLPLARWAKVTMLVQSAVSLALGALVVARAVNILR